MGNVVSSITSGFINVISDIFGAPLDFLSGKSCSSVCEPTWDLLCYIENFCVANLVKMVAVLALLYVVLLFVYLLYKIGCWQCVCKGACRMLWQCLVSCYWSCERGCMFVWFKLKNAKEDRRRRRMEAYELSSSGFGSDESISHVRSPRSVRFARSLSQRSRERRRIQLERSLRARSHRVRVGISQHSVRINGEEPRRLHRHGDVLHDVKVTHTSRFVQKGNAKRFHKRRLWP